VFLELAQLATPAIAWPLNGTGFGLTCSSRRPGADCEGGAGVGVGEGDGAGDGVDGVVTACVVVDGEVGDESLLHIAVTSAALQMKTRRPDVIVMLFLPLDKNVIDARCERSIHRPPVQTVRHELHA
jgi:hypothetical protein